MPPESGQIAPETYRHSADVPGETRRPILLFGDSYAQCVTGRETCFEGLLASSDLADEYVLLNYGVGGFGLDQAWLLYERAIENFAGRDPIVIVTTLVDADLARCLLRFRGWPKPRLAVDEAGKLRSIAPELMSDTGAYLEEHGLGIRSFAWNYLIYGTDWLPRSWRRDVDKELAQKQEMRALAGAIVRRWKRDLEQRGLESVFVLFQPMPHFDPGFDSWEQRFYVGLLERIEWPYQSCRDAIRADALETGRGLAAYYIQKGKDRNHYTPLGNELAFRAMRAGLAPGLGR